MAKAKTPKAEKPAEGEAPKKGKRKLILIAAPLLLGAAGAGLWFSGLLPGWLGMNASPSAQAAETHAETVASTAPAPPRVPVFFDMPEVTTNLNVAGRRATYLRLRSKLELARAEDSAPVQQAMPRLLDLFQTYLRELRPEELRGSAGTQRLREELVARANIAVHPARVTDVLFTEILVQ